jgi:hypothetical protein
LARIVFFCMVTFVLGGYMNDRCGCGHWCTKHRGCRYSTWHMGCRCVSYGWGNNSWGSGSWGEGERKKEKEKESGEVVGAAVVVTLCGRCEDASCPKCTYIIYKKP